MTWRSFFTGIGIGLGTTALLLIANCRWDSAPIVLSTARPPAGIRVSIQGAVTSPGVYTLPPNSMAQDAIQAAGGFALDAEFQRINLAARIADGQEIRVPTKAPAIPSSAYTQPIATGKINLNTASLAQLDTLPGIGPALAQRIIDYREKIGPFQTVDDLLKVKGIGASLFESIRDQVEAP
jgi:competence protein ComEA